MTAPARPPVPTPHADLLQDLHRRLAAQELADVSAKVAKRPLVLFFGRSTFSDNTKYLYLHAVAANPGYEVLWCTLHEPLHRQLRAAGLPVMHLPSDMRAAVSLLLSAAAVVFCENPHTALGGAPELLGALAGARTIQLWHGISVKPLDLMLLPAMDLCDPATRDSLRGATRVDHVLSPAACLDDFWVRAHGCTSVVRAGLPRNEVVVREARGLEWLGAELPPAVERALLDPSRRAVLLTPTWPRIGGGFLSSSAFVEQLAVWARDHDAVVIAKTHPFLRQQPLPGALGESVHFVESGVDLYPWMSRFHAMITDYSSIMFDFLLTGRPVCTFDVRPLGQDGLVEPDWSLVPASDFRYVFDETTVGAVLEACLARHTRAAAQASLRDALFETNPATACVEVGQLVAHAVATATARPFDVLHPEPGAPIA